MSVGADCPVARRDALERTAARATRGPDPWHPAAQGSRPRGR